MNKFTWSISSTIACIAICCIPTVSANDYYVATTGNDSANGTLATPWATVQHGADSVAAGDTLYVRGGTYNEKVTLTQSGSAGGGYITITNYPGESPVIDGTGITVGDETGLFVINSRDYIVLAGFEIRNLTTSTRWKVPMGIYVHGASSFIRLYDLTIHDIESNYDTGGNNINGADAHGVAFYGDHASNPITNIVIRGVEIYNCKLGSSEAMAINGNVDGFEVTGCTLHDNNNIGIVFIGHEGTCSTPSLDQARNGICTDNLVYNIATTDNQAYRNGGSYDRSADGLYVDGGKQIVLDRNTLHDCDIGIEVASEHNGKYASYITARNNLVYNNYTGGIFMGGYDSNMGNAQYCNFIGNTLYHNDTSDSYSGEITLQWHISDCRFENNLIVAQSNGGDAVYTGGPGNAGATPSNTTFDYNWYYSDESSNPVWTWGGSEVYTFSNWQSFGHEANGIYNTDPLFVNATGSNFHLQTNSLASDRGHSLTESGTSDIDGETRISGTAVDIGADEIQPPLAPNPSCYICIPDFDGDRKSDIAVFHPGAGDWYLLQSMLGFEKQGWGWNQVLPMPADYDGDGKTDITVYHPAKGMWYILQSKTDTMRKQEWGWSESTPVPGDYDGDGKADIAVFYPGTGTWYLLQSTDGRRIQNWGWSKVMPVPADYDGDGKTDIAVYYPAGGTWYVLQSKTTTMRKQGWGWSESTPVLSQSQLNGLFNMIP